MNSEERSNEEKFPRGSIGHTFPEAAALTEGLLAERNALESQVARLGKQATADHRGFIESRRSIIAQRDAALARIAAVEALCRYTTIEVPCPDVGCDDWFSAVRCVDIWDALAASPTPTGPEREHDWDLRLAGACRRCGLQYHSGSAYRCDVPATPEPTGETP